MKKTKIGIIMLLSLVIFALLTLGTIKIDLSSSFLKPSFSHLFGTDGLGRDLLSFSSQGLFVSLFIGLSSSIVSLLLGLMIALLMNQRSYLGVLGRGISNTFKVFPSVIFALFFVSLTGGGIWPVIIALSISQGANISKTLFAILSQTNKEEYIKATTALGLKWRTKLKNYYLPSLWVYIKEHFVISVLSNILTESSLSFLGLGVKPNTPTLGLAFSAARRYILSYPYMLLGPTIFLLTLSFSLFLISEGSKN